MTDYAKHPPFSDKMLFFTECTISEERAALLKEWLRNNTAPHSQVVSSMQDTAVYRAKWIKDNTGDLTTSLILEQYPHLMTDGMVRVNIQHVLIYCL